MKNIGISAVVALALSSSLAVADDALAEAFKNGSFNGSMGLFGMSKENKESKDSRDGSGRTYKKEGFATGFVEVGYQSAPLYGVSVGASAWGISEIENSQMAYEEDVAGKAIFHKRFIQVAHEGMGSITYGRQGVDLEWLTKYIDGAVVALTPTEELSVVLGWAKQRAKAGEDELQEFTPMNGNKGVYVLDVKYSFADMLTLNPYFYHAPDVMSAPGLKATLDYAFSDDMSSSTMVRYVLVKPEDQKEAGNVTAKAIDGSLIWVEQGFSMSGASLAVGFIKTDKKGGVGAFEGEEFEGIASFGDQSPFEEGNQVFGKDAKSIYASLGYEFDALNFGLLYGQTEYDEAKTKEKEIDVSLGFEVLKNLETSVVYANVKNDSDADSYSVVKLLASYSF